MTGKIKTTGSGSGTVYREEPVKPAIYTMLIIVAVVALPLGWLNQKIGAEGSRIADTSNYQELLITVNQDVVTLQRMLNNETVEEQELTGGTGPRVTLIASSILLTNLEEDVVQETERFEVELSGIFWSEDPVAMINGETYQLGETVLGHRIVGICKMEVVFENMMGEKIVKRLYEFLDVPPEYSR